jgi:transposase
LTGSPFGRTPAVAKPLLPDAVWAVIEPVLPKAAPSPKGGRPRLDDRKALVGILFVLKTGMAWEDLPAELNCGSGMTCWRRLAEWQADGTWDRIHATLLDRLDGAGKLDWSRAVIDSSSVRAVLGGSASAPTRPTAGRTG